MRRTAFLIVGGKVIYLPKNSDKSHREFAKEIGIDEKTFETLERGYFLKDKIVYFHGSDWSHDERTVAAAKKYSREIMQYCKVERAEIWCGVIVGKVGEIWSPLNHILTIDSRKV